MCEAHRAFYVRYITILLLIAIIVYDFILDTLYSYDLMIIYKI